jgi:hypothetical protein
LSFNLLISRSCFLQSKEKKTTHAISNQKTSVYIDHEPENIQGYIFAQLEELKKYFDKI